MKNKNLDPDYYLDIDDDLLDFLEKKGEQALNEVNNAYRTNKESAFKLLSILIIGIGASTLMLTSLMNLYEIVCLITFSAGWIVSALNLTINILTAKQRLIANRPPSYEYTNFYKYLTKTDHAQFKIDGYKGNENCLSILRRDRLAYLSESFDKNAEISKKVSSNLNISIWIASITPVLSILSYFIIYLITAL